MGTLKNLLLKVLVSAVQKMKLCEGASLAVSLLPSDTDLLRDLVFLCFIYMNLFF